LTEHHDVFESLGAFVLGALPEQERARVAAHLEECPICAEDAAALQRAATGLLEDVPMVEPPPELRDRIMAVVESEASLLRAASPSVPAPRRRMSLSGPGLRWVATAAAALVVGGLVGVTAFDGGTDTRTIAAEVGRGHAWIEQDDDQSYLVVDGLDSPGKGKVYELWIQTGDEAPRPAHDDLSQAVFMVQSGRVEIPARLEEGDRIMVTAENAGGSRVPTSTPVVVTQRV
jgi:anti-sigma-K factor RskA